MDLRGSSSNYISSRLICRWISKKSFQSEQRPWCDWKQHTVFKAESWKRNKTETIEACLCRMDNQCCPDAPIQYLTHILLMGFRKNFNPFFLNAHFEICSTNHLPFPPVYPCHLSLVPVLINILNAVWSLSLTHTHKHIHRPFAVF